MTNRAQNINDATLDFGKREGLLSGIKVLDMTRFLAGPFGSLILGDMGAEVLKIEPLTGDTTRTTPPHFFEGDSAYFMSVNRNKRSIALNPRSKQGTEILERLIANSDILLDNLRANQRQQLGLSYPELEKINPRIISCSVTGFGDDGPYSDRPAYDIVVEALAGVMSLTGPEGGPSVRAGVPIGDIVAGMYLAIGALGGLEYRRSTGKGQHIDVSMLDSQVSLLSYLAQYYFIGGAVSTHQGRTHVSNPTYNTFATADGTDLVIASNTPDMWKSLCSVLGRLDLIDDTRFASNPERLKNREMLEAILTDEFAKWDINQLYPALVAAEVPAAPINTIDLALSDPQIRHRDMVVKVRHHSGQEFVTLGNPIKTDDTDGGEFLSPPALGEHTRAVLTDVGYSADEIAEFVEQGAIKITPES